MSVVLPYHKGVLLQKGRGIGGVFSSLFRTLLPIGKTILKSSPRKSEVQQGVHWEGNCVNQQKSRFEYSKKSN